MKPRDLDDAQDTMADTISSLIKMADRLDQEGKHELAGEVDKTLKSLVAAPNSSLTSEAARPSAPLKHLDEPNKKGLILHLHKAGSSLKDTIEWLDEFRRRLGYFDAMEPAKIISIERLIDEAKDLNEKINFAGAKFFELTNGRHPGKGGIADYVKDIMDAPRGSAQDFFAAQMAKDKKEEEPEEIEDDEIEETEEDETEEKEECEEDEAKDIGEEDLKNFWDASQETK